MSSILEMAVASFEGRPQQKVEVPEWTVEGQPLVTVFFRTPNAKMLSRVQKESGSDTIEQAARLVALVATDENGKRLFGDADYTELMIRTNPSGISRVAAAILSTARIDVPAAEKN